LRSSLVVRDRNTGLPLVRVRQQSGVDFSAKEFEEGLSCAAHSKSRDDGSMGDGDQLHGQPVTSEGKTKLADPSESVRT